MDDGYKPITVSGSDGSMSVVKTTPDSENPYSSSFGGVQPPKVDLSNYGNWNGDYMGYLNYMASQGDPASLDKLINILTEQDARKWTAEREDTQYQRLVADLRAAGINPYILMSSGAQPVSSGASAPTGSQYSSYSINKEKNDQAWLKMLIGLIPITVAAIAMAL